MKVVTVVGTRPELIRLSLVFKSLEVAGIDHVLVHTGQNFDPALSDVFFEELDLPAPHHHLGIRAERVGDQIGQIISRSEQVLLDERPDALLVLGDTNSGLSAISATRMQMPIFHMEAGNRCFDWQVPEEKNRRLIDHISDWLLPYTARSREYLLAEGIPATSIFQLGNPITDVVEHYRGLWEQSDVLDRLALERAGFVLATAHRQENVDIPERLGVICEGLNAIAREQDLAVIWSVHPRTRHRLEGIDYDLDGRIQLHEPFGFADFVALEAEARLVVTDSGTVQEECSLLHVPTVTCRETTERPETVDCGSNVLSGVSDPGRMAECARVMLGAGRNWVSPYAGDTNVADKVTKVLVNNAR
jgi:UDP-N-acetylglucosamine 2-epimerase (non-hydrolysing)